MTSDPTPASRRAAKALTVILAAGSLVTLGGCVRDEPRSAEGYTFDELMDGVPADPDHYQIEAECFTTGDKSINGRVSHNLRIRLTNTDTKPRAFQVWSYRNGEQYDRIPREYQAAGGAIEFETFIGWQDDYPDGCPHYQLEVYHNPAEALADDQ